ncbi:MAG: GNAT family N-acetyltransferase [Flaviramulus sp.]|nr:GNAT family N-acetyltransferase [Flaviramulus sp.]NNC49814.1 GNAT family N-acetyltransferase [Flaviramulus sp.]
MKLKKVAISDINDLKNVCVASYSKNYHDHWDGDGLDWYLDREFSIDRLSTDLKDKNIDYYMIEYKLIKVGFIKINNKARSGIKNSIELEKIYLLPEFKGLGIGKLALNEIIIKATKRGINSIFLDVIDTNQNAITFYNKLGFVCQGKTSLELPKFKVELKGMYIMKKELK